MPRAVTAITQPVQLHAEGLQVEDRRGVLRVPAQQASGLPLEPLYTGKALLALKQQIEAGRLAPGTRLVFVHTGGLQGRRGFVD